MKLTNGKKIYLESKHYHGDGKGGRSLVVTDFGYDIVNLLNDIGYSTEIVWCQAPGIDKHVCGTVVAKKPFIDPKPHSKPTEGSLIDRHVPTQLGLVLCFLTPTPLFFTSNS